MSPLDFLVEKHPETGSGQFWGFGSMPQPENLVYDGLVAHDHEIRYAWPPTAIDQTMNRTDNALDFAVLVRINNGK